MRLSALALGNVFTYKTKYSVDNVSLPQFWDSLCHTTFYKAKTHKKKFSAHNSNVLPNSCSKVTGLSFHSSTWYNPITKTRAWSKDCSYKSFTEFQNWILHTVWALHHLIFSSSWLCRNQFAFVVIAKPEVFWLPTHKYLDKRFSTNHFLIEESFSANMELVGVYNIILLNAETFLKPN